MNLSSANVFRLDIWKSDKGFTVNSLPNDKTLDQTKSKAFAGDKINVTRKPLSVMEKVENTVGKGENAGYQHFLLFPQCFL